MLQGANTVKATSPTLVPALGTQQKCWGALLAAGPPLGEDPGGHGDTSMVIPHSVSGPSGIVLSEWWWMRWRLIVMKLACIFFWPTEMNNNSKANHSISGPLASSISDLSSEHHVRRLVIAVRAHPIHSYRKCPAKTGLQENASYVWNAFAGPNAWLCSKCVFMRKNLNWMTLLFTH